MCHIVASGFDQHRNRFSFLAQRSQDLDAVAIGQRKIEHNEIVLDDFQRRHRFVDALHWIDDKQVFFQPLDDQRCDLFIVFDDQNTHCLGFGLFDRTWTLDTPQLALRVRLERDAPFPRASVRGNDMFRFPAAIGR